MLRADTGPHALSLAALELLDEMGIGDVRACHAGHVDQPLPDGVAGGREIGDAGSVENRQLHLALEGGGLLEPGRHRALDARHVVEREVHGAIHAPVDRIPEIEEAGSLQNPRDFQALLEAKPLLLAHAFINHEAEADEEIIADALANGLVDGERKPAAVFQRPAPAIGALVHGGREELAHHVPAAERLDAVEPAFLAAPRRIRVLADDAGDIVLVHLLGEGAMLSLARGRGT